MIKSEKTLRFKAVTSQNSLKITALILYAQWPDSSLDLHVTENLEGIWKILLTIES